MQTAERLQLGGFAAPVLAQYPPAFTRFELQAQIAAKQFAGIAKIKVFAT
jgi:hypothetical protein